MSLIELTQQNYEEVVLKSNLPAVIEFYGTDCEACKLLTPIFEKVSNYYDGKANWMKCDRIINSEIARKYGIRASSQIAVVNKDKVLGILPGARISTTGAKGAVREEYLKEMVGRYLGDFVK